jgi:hypothetical protein
MSDRCPACDAMILGNEGFCRQCAAPLLSHLPPQSQRMRWLVRARAFVLINCLLAFGPVCMLATPPTALIAWPILVVLAGILIGMARQAAYPAAVKLGLVQGCSAFLWTATICSLRRIPSVEILTVPVVLLLLVALFVASLCVWQQHPARDLRFQCDTCGYWIRGQVVPRCPECGRRFDPARLDA